MKSAMAVRAAALALSVTFVAGGLAALGNYSNARFAAAVAAAERNGWPPAVEVSIAPSRIDVVAVRGVRTARTTQKSPNS